MSSLFTPGVKGPLGLQPSKYDVEVTMRGAAASVGEVLVFDFTATDAATTITADGVTAAGATTSIYSNVRNASITTDTDYADGIRVFCVALEAIADDAQGMVRVWGEVDALVLNGVVLVVGGGLTPNAAGQLVLTPTGERATAMALTAGDPGATIVQKVLFDGTATAFAGNVT